MSSILNIEEYNCGGCYDGYAEIVRELCTQIDIHGRESLTDQQQAFMEMVERNEVPELCPECME